MESCGINANKIIRQNIAKSRMNRVFVLMLITYIGNLLIANLQSTSDTAAETYFYMLLMLQSMQCFDM